MARAVETASRETDRSAPGQGPTAPRRRLTYWQRDRLSGYAFVAPQVLGFLVFLGLPVAMVFWYSLFDWNILQGNAELVGLGNYVDLAQDPRFALVLRNTAVFTLGLVPLNLSLALFLAVLLNNRLRGVTVFRTLFFAPVVVSLVAWAIVWEFLLQADGGINLTLAALGIDGPNWLRERGWAMAAIIVVQVFKNVGLNMVLFLAALQSVPEDVQEAARIDGAGPLASFRHVVLPLIAPTVLLVSIITVIGSFQVFATVEVLTGGGPGSATNVLVYYIYQQAFQLYEAGRASAGAVILFFIVMALTVIQWQLRKRWIHYEQDD